MTLSEIIYGPAEQGFIFDGDSLGEFLVLAEDLKMGNGFGAGTSLRLEGVIRVKITPVKNLAPSRQAYEEFVAGNTDAPFGYAFGREFFYQNADGNAPSLLTICGVKRPHLCEGCGNPVMGGGCTCPGRPVRK